LTALPSEAAADQLKLYPASLEQLGAMSCTAAMMRVARPRGTAPATAEDAAMDTPMEQISQCVPLPLYPCGHRSHVNPSPGALQEGH